MVRDDAGQPVAGALVMGVDLGFAETAEDGSFTIQNPEMALFVWCTGFYPRAHILDRRTQTVEVVVRAIKMKKRTAEANEN